LEGFHDGWHFFVGQLEALCLVGVVPVVSFTVQRPLRRRYNIGKIRCHPAPRRLYLIRVERFLDFFRETPIGNDTLPNGRRPFADKTVSRFSILQQRWIVVVLCIEIQDADTVQQTGDKRAVAVQFRAPLEAAFRAAFGGEGEGDILGLDFDSSSNARLRGDFTTIDRRDFTSNLQRRGNLVRDFLAGKNDEVGFVKGLLAASQQALNAVNQSLGLSGTFVDTYA